MSFSFSTATCLLCKKELQCDKYHLYEGGFINIEFHYGSRYDQCLGFDGRKSLILGDDGNPKSIDMLLASDSIQAYICDKCFEDNIQYMRGYNNDPKTEWTTVFDGYQKQ